MINPFKKTYDTEEINLFRFLGKVSLFEKLSFDELALFLPYLHLRDYKQNEVVFFRQDPSHALYIVKSGTISVELDFNGGFERIGELGSNDAFGENCLLSERRRIFSALVTSESAKVYVLPQVNIMEIFNRKPKIKGKVMEAFAGQLDHQLGRLIKTYKTSPGISDFKVIYLK